MKNLFFAPISSFYRNNLYNELSKKYKFLVIYINKKMKNLDLMILLDNKSKYKRINYFKLEIIKKILLLNKILFNKEKKMFLFVDGIKSNIGLH